MYFLIPITFYEDLVKRKLIDSHHVSNSPCGRYRFKRMRFGISCASEVAQNMVEKYFGDILGALPIFDDFIIGD